MKANWASVGIIIALLVVAAAIFFAGITIPRAVSYNVDKIKDKARREMVAFAYAFRKAAMEDRITLEKDFEEGYIFADKYLVGKR